jgi:PKD repeat protein
MRKIYLSVVLSFFVIVLMAQNKINQYEYWFDGNYANKITTNITPVVNYQLNTQIATSGLSTGLHVINVRFRDDSLKYSSVVSQFFYKMDAAIPTSNSLLVSYEYWFDGDYANKISSSFSGTNSQEQLVNTITTGSLNTGLHVFHIRFKDNSNKWSSVLSQFFYKQQPQIGSPTPLLSEYEYWFDNNYSQKVSSSFSGTNSQETIIGAMATDSLNFGLHIFHIRFKDNNHKWSSVLSQFFYKQSNSTSGGNTLLTAYEYWFDNDYGNKVLTSFSGTNPQENFVSAITTAAVNAGLHTFHIRFKDNNNRWSLVSSQFFYKLTDQALANNNFMTAYRYWFDSNETTISTIYFASPSSQVHVIETIDLTHLWKGAHTIHFQFKDTFDIWSVVTTDTVVKEALPIASFYANDTSVCVGDTVSFLSQSVDGDTHIWNFGDGNSSTDSITTHAYSIPGVYVVSLTVNDSLSGRDSTITQQIVVTGYPVATIIVAGNVTLCMGQNTQLDLVTSNATILWNTTETSSSINVGMQGDYYAVVTSLANSSCAIHSDTVNIVVNPLPVVELGADTSICEGDTIFLDATNLNSTYLWNTGAQTATLNVVQTNQYSVTVTNQFACTQSDTIDVVVNPLPVADFTYNINNQTITFTNNSQYGTSYAWDFGDGNTSNAPSPTNTFPATGGTFIVQLTVINACGTATFSQTVTVQPNSIYEYDSNGFEVDVFPNPAIDKVNINVTLETKTSLKVNIYDYTGKLIETILDETRPKGMQYIWYNTQQ